jgi:dCTP diphosphatase
MDLERLKDELRAFAADRDWEPFHSPKNLSMALAVEAAELMEHFQWLTEAQSRDPDPALRAKISEEIGDVLIYLTRLADQLDVDLMAAAGEKMARNAEKYPVEKARGSAAKYTEL